MAQQIVDDQDWEPTEVDWKPPTEAEMKVLQAKRERSDKISKLMGAYLLKGYKMLGTSCSTCGTILLRSKQGVDYCVACVELDSDTDKDDPALNQEAARRQAAEQSQREVSQGGECLETPSLLNGRLQSESDLQYSTSEPLPLRTSYAQAAAGFDEDEKPCYSVSDLPPTGMGAVGLSGSRATGRMPTGSVRTSGDVLQSVNHSVQSVQEKMTWASRELAASNSVEYSMNVCQLIKTCADTLASLGVLQGGHSRMKEEH